VDVVSIALETVSGITFISMYSFVIFQVHFRSHHPSYPRNLHRIQNQLYRSVSLIQHPCNIENHRYTMHNLFIPYLHELIRSINNATGCFPSSMTSVTSKNIPTRSFLKSYEIPSGSRTALALCATYVRGEGIGHGLRGRS
jgi:hypothetical protein